MDSCGGSGGFPERSQFLDPAQGWTGETQCLKKLLRAEPEAGEKYAQCNLILDPLPVK